MKAKSKLTLLTILSVMLANTLVMFLTFPVLLNYIENTYIQIQLDSNKSQSEVLAKFLDESLKKGINQQDLLEKFQDAIVGSQSEKGFVCIIDTSGVFINHPDKSIVGQNVKHLNIHYKSSNKGIVDNWFDILKTEINDGGIINYNTNNAEIVYSFNLMSRPWKVNSHENTARIKSEILELRYNLFAVAGLITVLMAALASFFVRKVSHKYESTIENYNTELELKVNDLNIANKSLENLNQEKNNFLHIVAHDLKNPLSGILLTIELIERYFKKMTEEELLQKLSNVKKTSNFMKDIIGKLLNNELLEQGNVKVVTKELNLLSFIDEVVHYFNNHAEKKNIDIIVSKRLEFDTINIDPQLLREIIDNYVSNAIKYSPHNTSIEINVETTLLDATQSLEIFIVDKGAGVDESEQHLLFQKFSTLSSQPTDGEDSTGLGLYSVKKNAEAMGGEVYATFKKGECSTFGFIIKM